MSNPDDPDKKSPPQDSGATQRVPAPEGQPDDGGHRPDDGGETPSSRGEGTSSSGGEGEPSSADAGTPQTEGSETPRTEDRETPRTDAGADQPAREGATPPEELAATRKIPPGEPTGASGPPHAGDPNATRRLPDDIASPHDDPNATRKLPDDVLPPAPDPNATVMFTAEDVARLEKETAAVEAATEEEDPLIGTLIRDKWKVLTRLGAGSFGTVYKVEDVKGGWIEALKILGVDRLTGAEAEEMRARFLREAQIMKRLGKDSHHIVGLSTYEEDIEAGLIYFLMEFVEGRSLGDALSQEGPFTVERTIGLALQVCDALMAAHEGPEPVVHRDLKLENLMLTKDRSGGEMVKVLDFGIAKIAERDADSRLTTVGTLGTPGYAAPEQLRAEAVDGRTDLFAFGVILYALLTGRDPWLGNLAHEPTHQIYELMVATDRAEVRPMGDAGVSIPPEMINVVMKLLRRDPDQRFRSARELRDALERVASGDAVGSTGTISVSTDEPGVQVEVRDGRTVVGGGATPLTVAALPTGSYTVVVRDGRFHASETSVVLTPGAVQDVRLPTTVRAPGTPPATPRSTAATEKKSRKGRLVAAVLVLLGIGATTYAQPWGRTLEQDAFWNHVQGGAISSVWVTDGGIEGGLQIIPLEAEAAREVRMPFFVDVPEGEIVDAVRRLRDVGVEVDASWEIHRLTQLAVEAQGRNRYFGLVGGDVRSYALRLAALVPGSQEAESLLFKVGERMAWDAEVALEEGETEQAGALVAECLQLVSEHPRCLEVSAGL